MRTLRIAKAKRTRTLRGYQPYRTNRTNRTNQPDRTNPTPQTPLRTRRRGAMASRRAPNVRCLSTPKARGMVLRGNPGVFVTARSTTWRRTNGRSRSACRDRGCPLPVVSQAPLVARQSERETAADEHRRRDQPGDADAAPRDMSVGSAVAQDAVDR